MRRLVSWLVSINHLRLTDRENSPPDPTKPQSALPQASTQHINQCSDLRARDTPHDRITFAPVQHVICCRASEQHCALSENGSRLSSVLLPPECLDLAAGLQNDD